MSIATTDSAPKLKATASRTPKIAGFEPSVEETGSIQELVAEEQQKASQGFVGKKKEQFLKRDRQRGVSFCE